MQFSPDSVRARVCQDRDALLWISVDIVHDCQVGLVFDTRAHDGCSEDRAAGSAGSGQEYKSVSLTIVNSRIVCKRQSDVIHCMRDGYFSSSRRVVTEGVVAVLVKAYGHPVSVYISGHPPRFMTFEGEHILIIIDIYGRFDCVESE